MSCALPQWLEFSSPAVEKLYWDYFAQSWVQVDKNVSLLYIFFGSTFLHRIWAYNPWCAMLPPLPPAPLVPPLLSGSGDYPLRCSHGVLAAASPSYFSLSSRS